MVDILTEAPKDRDRGDMDSSHGVHPPTVIDIVDETFVRADPRRVRDLLDRMSSAVVWPGLTPEVTLDRGTLGVHWHIDGEVVGRMEIWLEEVKEGTLVHHFVQGRLTRAPSPWTTVIARAWPNWPSERAATAYERRHARSWKSAIHTLKDHAEGRER